MGISVIGGAAGGGAALPVGTSAFIQRRTGRGFLALPELTAGTNYAVKLLNTNGCVTLGDNGQTYYPSNDGWVRFTPAATETTARVFPGWKTHSFDLAGREYKSSRHTNLGVSFDGRVFTGLYDYSFSGNTAYRSASMDRNGVYNREGGMDGATSQGSWFPGVALTSAGSFICDYPNSGYRQYKTGVQATGGFMYSGTNFGLTGQQYITADIKYSADGKRVYVASNRQGSGSYLHYTDDATGNSFAALTLTSGNIPSSLEVDEANDKVYTLDSGGTLYIGSLNSPYTSQSTTSSSSGTLGLNRETGDLMIVQSNVVRVSSDQGVTWTALSGVTGFANGNYQVLEHLTGDAWVAWGSYGGFGSQTAITYNNGQDWEVAPATMRKNQGWYYSTGYVGGFGMMRPTADLMVALDSSNEGGSYGTVYAAFMDLNIGYELFEAADS